MAEEERGFVIRDRRGGGAESDSRPSADAGRTESSGGGTAPPQQADTTGQADDAQTQHIPPINFPSFVYSMGTSALMLLGEAPGQGSTSQAPNLAHAQEIIDILTMLKTKTKGNLTHEEEILLEEMLYALHVKFVEKAGAKKT